jgi:flagellar secretion chaperone FliS
MLNAYARSQYQEMQVQTTPGRLVVMLYDGALRFLHLGLDALQRGDRQAQGLNLGKAQNILVELMNTLDKSAGPLADNLEALYRYCLKRLLIAHAEDRGEDIEEVMRLLLPLRDAWEQAERTFHSTANHSEDRNAALVGAAR